jgi:type IV pilus assembly protein PilA
MPTDRNRGFTLIELMLVIAIVAILAAAAIPAYQGYSIRAKMSEPLAFLSEGKTSISEYYVTHGRMPTTAGEAGMATDIDTDVVASLNWDASQLQLLVTVKDVGGSTDTYNQFGMAISTTYAGLPQWVCGATFAEGSALELNYLPSSCRADLSGF